MCTYHAFWTFERLRDTLQPAQWCFIGLPVPFVDGIFAVESRDISILEAEGKEQRVDWCCNCEGSE